jgi:hypothetical protein
MSVMGTATRVDRANAAFRAAPPVERPPITARHGARFVPAIVASVSRDGLARAVRVKVGNQDWPLTDRDWRRILVDSGPKVAARSASPWHWSTRTAMRSNTAI